MRAVGLQAIDAFTVFKYCTFCFREPDTAGLVFQELGAGQCHDSGGSQPPLCYVPVSGEQGYGAQVTRSECEALCVDLGSSDLAS